MKKIKILFYNVDQAGVNYFRTLTPAIELENNHSDKFHVEIKSEINFDDENIVDYLKSFDIIHYHRQLVPNIKQMLLISDELKKSGTILVVDIDDYWHLHKQHPFYSHSVEKKMHIPIIENLKIADYVTTTSEIFAEEIKKITGKDNVGVFYNSINPSWMKQFQNNWKPDPNGFVRITYMAGSSHLGDIQQLENVINILSNDWRLKDKFKIIIAGWDTEGSTTDIIFNQELGTELQKRGLWDYNMVKMINKTKGDIDAIPTLPNDIKDKYRGKIFSTQQRDVKSEESVYYQYEKILTDNHKLIKNDDYLQWLSNFDRNDRYDDCGNFERRWTEKANAYAKVLDDTDIVIAPLSDNKFNRFKSNLKQVECWTRKLPIVCSDIPPYNVHGRHMENCILIPNVKNAHKYWTKNLKKLILEPELRQKLGEQLHDDFKIEYNLEFVTKKRANFYEKIVNKK